MGANNMVLREWKTEHRAYQKGNNINFKTFRELFSITSTTV